MAHFVRAGIWLINLDTVTRIDTQTLYDTIIIYFPTLQQDGWREDGTPVLVESNITLAGSDATEFLELVMEQIKQRD